MTATSFTSPMPIPRGYTSATQSRKPPAATAAMPRSARLPGSVAAAIAAPTMAPTSKTALGITRRSRSVRVIVTSRVQKREPEGELAEVVGAEDQDRGREQGAPSPAR